MTKARPILIASSLTVVGVVLLLFWCSFRKLEAVALAPSGSSAAPDDAQTPAALELPARNSGEPDFAAREPAPSPAGAAGIVPVDDLALATGEAELRVLVITKERGDPLARLPLFLWRRNGGSWPREHLDGWRAREGQIPRTNEAGRASFVVTAPEEFELYVDPEERRIGRVQVSVSEVEPGERRELTIEVWSEDDVHFFGRVCALEGEQPIEGATIELCVGDVIWTEAGRNVDRSTVRESTRSGPDGLFELRSASWIDEFARAQAPGYSQLRFVPTPGHDTPQTALPIRLARGAAVRAHVSDADGKPLADVEVHLRAEPQRVTLVEGVERQRLGGDLDRRAVTARDGSAVIEDLPAQVPLALALEQDGVTLRRKAAEFALEPGEFRDVELRLGAGIALGGSVLDQREVPVANAHLWLLAGGGTGRVILDPWNLRDLTAEALSDAGGRFLFEDVVPGKYQLAPSPGGWGGESAAQGLAAIAREIDVAAAPAAQEITLHVQRGLYIRGRVQGSDGKGVARAWVRANAVDGAGEVGTRCDDNGAFNAGGLVPGSYTLKAGGVGRADAFAESEPVTADAGEADVLLVVRRGAAILGRVVDQHGELRVAELSIGGSARTVERAADLRWPAKGGRFEIGGLHPGTLRLCASTNEPAFAFERVELKEGSRLEDLVLELRPGARIKLSLEASQERMRVDVSHPSGFEACVSMRPGASATMVVPPGEITLACAGSASGDHRQTVTAKLGELAQVALRRP